MWELTYFRRLGGWTYPSPQNSKGTSTDETATRHPRAGGAAGNKPRGVQSTGVGYGRNRDLLPLARPDNGQR